MRRIFWIIPVLIIGFISCEKENNNIVSNNDSIIRYTDNRPTITVIGEAGKQIKINTIRIKILARFMSFVSGDLPGSTVTTRLQEKFFNEDVFIRVLVGGKRFGKDYQWIVKINDSLDFKILKQNYIYFQIDTSTRVNHEDWGGGLK